MDIGIKKSNGMPDGWVLGLYNDGHVPFKEVHTALHRYLRYREIDEMISYWVYNRETKQHGMWIPLDVIVRNGEEAVEVGLLLYTIGGFECI